MTFHVRRWSTAIALAATGLAGLASGHLLGSAAVKQIGLLLVLVVVLSLPLYFVAEQLRGRILRVLAAYGLRLSVFVVIFLATGELLLRVGFPGGVSFGSRSGALVRDFERDFAFNRFDGPSRGPEPAADADDTFLVLVQGDSISWGQGVADERKLFTSLLLEEIKGFAPRASMAVLAKPGREIDGHLEQLRKWGPELDPEVILYQWYINDIELDKERRPRATAPWRRLFFHRMVYENSYFWSLLDFGLTALTGPGGHAYERYLEREFAPGSRGWNAFERRFDDWAVLAKEQTPIVFVAAYPHLALRPGHRPERSNVIASFHRRIETLASSAGIVYVDLFDSLLPLDSAVVRASRFDDHPSARAHAAIAAALSGPLRRAIEEAEPPRGRRSSKGSACEADAGCGS